MREILKRLIEGELGLDEAEAELRRAQLVELDGRARLDVGRPGRRGGLPEVVLAEGKQPKEAATLIVALARDQGQGLGSRLGDAHRAALEGAAGDVELRWYGRAVRAVRPGWAPEPRAGRVAVVTAGTSDLEVALEAVMMVEAAGLEARLEADVGVAGLHRLLGPLAELEAWEADCYVVAAGMDGVLPGVIAGLVAAPVVGIPVSTGYGHGGAGEAALGTMLQSCSTGLTVVNIDNGIGAGAAALLIAGRAATARRPLPAAERRP